MKIDLTRIRTREQLIRFLQVEEVDFQQVLSFNVAASLIEQDADEQVGIIGIPIFFRHEIPKRNRKRGYRTVWEPSFHLNAYKALSRRLGNFFSFALPNFPHPRAFGYVGGKNIRENAWDHRGKKFLISVDIAAFFPSIKKDQISKILQSAGVNEEVADLLSGFVTIDGALALGLPTSPTIANAICLKMDVELQKLAQQSGSIFSRYADDISFSSDTILPSIDQIRAIVNAEGFDLAEEKTQRSRIGQAHFVTGLSVSDPAQPHVPSKKKRRLRQEIHYASKFGLDSHFRHQGINDSHVVQMEINRLDGLVKYVAFHEPRQSAKLKTAWSNILQASGDKPSFAPKNQHRTPFIFHIDEAEYVRGEERFLALGMSVSQHQNIIDGVTEEILNAELSDIWAAGKRDTVVKRGIHFSDATQDLRLKYVEKIPAMPFEGYVAFARLRDGNSYQQTYLRLLGALITRRLMAAESRSAQLNFEVNNKVSEAAIRTLVSAAHDDLRKTNNRHPTVLGVEFVSKPHLGMSVPDFLLGILGLYLKSGSDAATTDRVPRDKLLFERMRDKYRLILDVDSWQENTRRNPISPW
jgi:RNA-directed DNA polymerase